MIHFFYRLKADAKLLEAADPAAKRQKSTELPRIIIPAIQLPPNKPTAPQIIPLQHSEAPKNNPGVFVLPFKYTQAPPVFTGYPPPPIFSNPPPPVDSSPPPAAIPSLSDLARVSHSIQAVINHPPPDIMTFTSSLSPPDSPRMLNFQPFPFKDPITFDQNPPIYGELGPQPTTSDNITAVVPAGSVLQHPPPDIPDEMQAVASILQDISNSSSKKQHRRS